MVCFLVPLIAGNRYGVLPWISPLHFVALFGFFGVFVKSLVYPFYPELAFYNYFEGVGEHAYVGYMYVALFVVALTAGYVFAVGRRRFEHVHAYARLSADLVVRRRGLLLFSVAVFVLVISEILRQRGLAGFLEVFSTETLHALNKNKIVAIEGVEGYGKSFAGLKSLFIVPMLSFVMFLSIYQRRPNFRNGVAAFAMLVVCVFIALLNGKRMDIVALLIYAFCVLIMLGHRIDRSLVIKVLLGLAGVIAMYIIMTALRSTKGELEGIDYSIGDTLLKILGSPYFLDVNMSVLIVEFSDPNQRFLGETYFWWLFAWVPRELWPDKPAISLGPYVKQEVLGLYGSIGGLLPTGPGEAFLNFGWFGVLVGSLLGAVYRRIEEFMLGPGAVLNGGSLWIYPLIFYSFIEASLQSSFSGVIVTALLQLLICLAMFAVFKRRVSVGGARRLLTAGGGAR